MHHFFILRQDVTKLKQILYNTQKSVSIILSLLENDLKPLEMKR